MCFKKKTYLTKNAFCPNFSTGLNYIYQMNNDYFYEYKYFVNWFIIRTLAEEKLAKFKEGLDELQNARIQELNEMNEKLERQRKRTEELTELVRHIPCTLNSIKNIIIAKQNVSVGENY